MSANSNVATASIMALGSDLKIKEDIEQSFPVKSPVLSIDDIALSLNRSPYSITCRPTQDLTISKDDSLAIDVYAYTLKELVENTLLQDTIDYFIATKGEVRERRIALLIPDEKGIPAAYIFDLMQPNYIAIHLLNHIIQVLSLKPGTDIAAFLAQNKQIDEQTKKILQSISNAFVKSNKSILSFMLSDKNILNCFVGLYNKVDFKYIGSNVIHSKSKEIVALALSKISKSKPLNPSYSKPRPQDIFCQTLVERIVSVLFFGNENIEKLCLDELYAYNESLKEQTPTLNKLLYIQRSEKMLQHLTSPPSSKNDEPNNSPNSMSFAFKFQFLSNRKKPAEFLKWMDTTFKTHIEKLEKLIIKFTSEFKVTNQNEHEIIQKIKKMIALFPILKSTSIQLSLRPAFYLDLLDFLACRQDISMVKTLLNETLNKIEPHIKRHFLAFFNGKQVLNPTSNEYLINEAIIGFIRFQILNQLRNDHYGLKMGDDLDSLKLLLKTDNIIRDVLTAKSANELLKDYLPSLELDFMQEFLIQPDRLTWLNKLNADLLLESFKLTSDLLSQIQKLEATTYPESMSRVFFKIYNLTLPGISSRLFSSLSNTFNESRWLSMWNKFRGSQDDTFHLWAFSRPAQLLSKTSDYVADFFKISKSCVVGFGLGLYAADPYQQLQFIAANWAFQQAFEYFRQPTLEQLLKEYDSARIVQSFDPKAKPFLTYYHASNSVSQDETSKTAAEKGNAVQNSNTQIISNSASAASAAASSDDNKANAEGTKPDDSKDKSNSYGL